MPADITLYFDVVKKIHDQVNRITYANHLNEQERLSQLYKLEHEISQKFQWARRSIDTVGAKMVKDSQSNELPTELNEMDVA